MTHDTDDHHACKGCCRGAGDLSSPCKNKGNGGLSDAANPLSFFGDLSAPPALPAVGDFAPASGGVEQP